MNNFIKTTLVCCLLAVIAPLNAQTYWNGTTASNWTGSGNSAADPYLITTAEQLAGIAAAVNAGNDMNGKFIKLAADLYLSNPADDHENKPQWTPIGDLQYTGATGGGSFSWTADTAFFRGTFDGGGHSIYNAYYNTVPDLEDWNDPFGMGTIDFSGWYKGFFGYVEGGTIKNLHLVDATIVGAATMGGLVVINSGGSIINCSITGQVMSVDDQIGGGAGGLVGENKAGGIIENCHSGADVKGIRGTGGLVGINYGIIRDSYATGQIYGSQYNTGGFVGLNNGYIEDAYATGAIEKQFYHPDECSTGGFAGTNGGNGATITRCYATGNVTSVNGAAGFVGLNGANATVSDCYTSSNVTAQNSSAYTFTSMNGAHRDYYAAYTGEPGLMVNCFSTGNAVNTFYPEWARGFAGDAFDAGPVINCYYNSATVSRDDRAGSEYRTTAQMQTQAFVDTLNRVAALFGTSTWQYRAGDFPIPTGIQASNLTDYLAGGTGTQADPYRIQTKEQLENFAFYVNKKYLFLDKYVKLEADIALNAPFEDWGTVAPTQWEPIGPYMPSNTQQLGFMGTFDGDGHEISNLYLDNTYQSQGFFGVLKHGAVIKNLGIVDVYLKGGNETGIMAGTVTVTDLGSEGDPRYTSVKITQCWTSGEVEARTYTVGGFIASAGNENVIMKNSYSTANIKAANEFALALLGDSVENSYFAGTLTAFYSAQVYPTLAVIDNLFYNRETSPGQGFNAIAKTTTEMQSKDFVNLLNYWVSVQNEQGAEQYLYWQHNEGGYPTFTSVVPPHSVIYNSNGGSPVTTQRALDASRIAPPPAPEKANYTFAGWYADNTLTEIFDFDTVLIAGDTTLYAKWVEVPGIDITPFSNSFANTYIIYTKEQLAGFAALVNGAIEGIAARDFTGKTIKLGNNILLNDTADWKYYGTYAFANQWTPIGNWTRLFKGTFDGDNYTVSGMYINQSDRNGGGDAGNNGNELGLFGYAGSGALIKNVGVKAAFVGGHRFVGGLIGKNEGSITDCYAHATVIALSDEVGGLAGQSTTAISNCYATGDVSGVQSVGGLVGYGNGFTNCHATGNVNGQLNVGGLVGANSINSTISACYATGNVNGGNYTGGLAGWTQNTTISNSSATGTVNGGAYYVGGLVGHAQGSSISNSSATGNVTGTGECVGGLAGGSGTISNSSATGNVSGTSRYVGGLVGEGGGISNSSATGNVSGGFYGVGGLAGRTESNVSYCFATGDVIGTENSVGGLIGYHVSGVLSNCFARGDVSGQNEVGGLVGRGNFSSSIISYCYATGSVSGTGNNVGGVIGGSGSASNSYYDSQTSGQSGTASGNTPKTTAEMKTKATFTGWNFTDTWGRNNSVNNGYPYLRWMLDEYLADDEDRIAVTGVTLNKTATALTVGETEQLAASVQPANAINQNVTWGSDNESVATVVDGLITPHTVGTATITVTTTDGGFTAQCVVTVTQQVTGITLNKTATTIAPGNTEQLTASVQPANATNQTISWSSNNESVATVVNGLITTHRNGTATITVTTEDGGFTAQCVVTVGIAVTGITLNKTATTLMVGGTERLTATVLPSNADNQNVSWSSDNESVATVAANGRVRTHTAGTATITVTTADGGFTAQCVVIVNAESVAVTGVQLNKTATTLTAGNTEQLTATVQPLNATNQNVSWSSDDESVATVVDGLITAHAAGTAIITVTTEDGNFTAICTVDVTLPTNIETLQAGGISVYPNPVENYLFIDSGGQSLDRIRIINISGVVVVAESTAFGKIDVSQLAEGIYFLIVRTDSGDYQTKFIKK